MTENENPTFQKFIIEKGLLKFYVPLSLQLPCIYKPNATEGRYGIVSIYLTNETFFEAERKLLFILFVFTPFVLCLIFYFL